LQVRSTGALGLAAAEAATFGLCQVILGTLGEACPGQ
jgi:hypothetical protein